MFNYKLINFSFSKSKHDVNEENGHANNKVQENENKSLSLIHDQKLLSRRGYLLFEDHLGDGTYSKVKRAYSKYRQCDVAVKIVNRKNAPKDFLNHFFPRELEIIGNIKHPNICQFYEVLDAGSKVYIVMELAKNGDLLEYIKKYKVMAESNAINFFAKIVSAVRYLHSKNIFHRDLKCENILIGSNMKPLLSDFGFAKYTANKNDLNNTFCGSSAYAPIELLKGVPYDGSSAEVWSLGVILFIITTGVMPFNDMNKADQIKQMQCGPGFSKIKQKISEQLRQLILKMLNVEPKARITLEGIEKSKWMRHNFNV